MSSLDPELAAMKAVIDALSSLQDDEAARVVRWAVEKRGLQVAASPRPRQDETKADTSSTKQESSSAFGSIADLFDAANPETDVEKALVAGYWHQIHQGQEDFESFPLNSDLKHLGHGVANITRALDGLMRQTPRLAIQVRKAGSARQARKRYKLTVEGIRRVESMISSGRTRVEEEDR